MAFDYTDYIGHETVRQGYYMDDVSSDRRAVYGHVSLVPTLLFVEYHEESKHYADGFHLVISHDDIDKISIDDSVGEKIVRAQGQWEYIEYPKD